MKYKMLIRCLFLILILCFQENNNLILADESIEQTNLDNETNIDDNNNKISVYESTNLLLSDLQLVVQSIQKQYWNSISNITNSKDNLANWIAFSQILDQVNDALVDSSTSFLGLMDKVSGPCGDGLIDLLQGLKRQESWAYKMIDSNGFVTSGVLEGSYANFGDFDECINVHQLMGRGKNKYLGGYCLIKFHLNILTNKTRLVAQDLIFNTTGTLIENTFLSGFLRYAHYFQVKAGRIGLCMPASCTKNDVQSLIDEILRIDRFLINVESCQTVHDNDIYSNLQVIILLIFAVILIAVLLFTFIDLTINEQRFPSMSSFVGRISIAKNTRSLFQSSKQENLESLNGLRVLTMFWLVYCHAYLLSVKESFRSSTAFIESLFHAQMYFLYNAFPAVDIFFILSAMLHSYNFFRNLQKNNSINIFQLICNRIARLWPSLWFIIGLAFVIPKLAQGPLWNEIMDQQSKSCYQFWWKIITFNSNLRNDDNLCHIHTWYLSADVQLFMISFVILLLIYKFQKRAILIMSISNLLLCTIITISFYINQQIPTVLFNQIDEMQMYRELFQVYMPTYLHFSPYLVGIVTSYLLIQQKKQQKQFSPFFDYIWILSLALILMIIFGSYFFTIYPQTPVLIQSLYAGFHRLIWSLSFAYIIFYCETKKPGTSIVKDFLSCPVFIPLSKLCYLIYLLHFIITWTRFAYTRQSLVFSHYTMLNEFIINSVYSVVFAFIVHVLIEAPFSNIYGFYIGKRKWTIGELRLKSQDKIEITKIELKS